MSLPAWQRIPILSGRTARRLLAADPDPVTISLDLGKTESTVVVEDEHIVLPDGERVVKADLADAFSEPEDCILVRHGRCSKVYHYSDAARRYYKLYQPYEDKAPTIIINNATMHAIVGRDPWRYVADKVRTVPPFKGTCLDTCCGLGYSAQMLAARDPGPVTTCEVDANVLEIAAVNPWSEGLFGSADIDVVHADVRDHLARCPEGSLACIFHDPPTVYQAGDLYSEGLYGRLARALRPSGILYHYVGDPGRRAGRDYAHGVIRRLQAAGFTRVRRVTDGVLAFRRR